MKHVSVQEMRFKTTKHIKEAEDYYMKERANSLTAVTTKYKADLYDL